MLIDLDKERAAKETGFQPLFDLIKESDAVFVVAINTNGEFKVCEFIGRVALSTFVGSCAMAFQEMTRKLTERGRN